MRTSSSRRVTPEENVDALAAAAVTCSHRGSPLRLRTRKTTRTKIRLLMGPARRHVYEWDRRSSSADLVRFKEASQEALEHMTYSSTHCQQVS